MVTGSIPVRPCSFAGTASPRPCRVSPHRRTSIAPSNGRPRAELVVCPSLGACASGWLAVSIRMCRTMYAAREGESTVWVGAARGTRTRRGGRAREAARGAERAANADRERPRGREATRTGSERQRHRGRTTDGGHRTEGNNIARGHTDKRTPTGETPGGRII
jgi:hypothetical protein